MRAGTDTRKASQRSNSNTPKTQDIGEALRGVDSKNVARQARLTRPAKENPMARAIKQDLLFEAATKKSQPKETNAGAEISIRGIAGPYVVIGSNFAPGTTAADIESAMLPVGGEMQSCRIMTAAPTVMAEMVFADKENAELVINTFNNKKVQHIPDSLLARSNFDHILRLTDACSISICTVAHPAQHLLHKHTSHLQSQKSRLRSLLTAIRQHLMPIRENNRTAIGGEQIPKFRTALMALTATMIGWTSKWRPLHPLALLLAQINRARVAKMIVFMAVKILLLGILRGAGMIIEIGIE